MNPKPPNPRAPSPQSEEDEDGKPMPILRRAQEVQHVQERFSRVSPSPQAPGAPAPVKVEPVAPPPEHSASPSRAASALWLASSLFALVAAVLFVLPELRGLLKPADAFVVYTPTEAPPPPASPSSVTTEETSPFQGFVLVIDSEPASASIRVNGEDQGSAPVSMGMDCAPGSRVEIEFIKRGYERARHTTTCRQDAMVKVLARMRKPERKPAANP